MLHCLPPPSYLIILTSATAVRDVTSWRHRRTDVHVITRRLCDRRTSKHLRQSQIQFFWEWRKGRPQIPRQTRPYGARERHQASPVSRVPPLSNTWLRHCNSWVFLYTCMWCSEWRRRLSIPVQIKCQLHSAQTNNHRWNKIYCRCVR